MKYTDFNTKLILLLVLQRVGADHYRYDEAVPQVAGSDSDSDGSVGSDGSSGSSASTDSNDSADSAAPPPHQDIPRLITAPERLSLLQLIKDDKHADIVTFFKDNDLIDFPLIRFKTEDEVNGYTPLAAAVRHCAMDTAKVLAPLQFDKPWTAQLGPRHSLAEIASKYCPELLSEAIKDQKNHPLAKMIRNLDVSEITQVLADALENNAPETKDACDTVIQWIASRFSHKDVEAPETEDNGEVDGELRPATNRADQNLKALPVSSYNDLTALIDYWISSGRPIDTLVAFLRTDIYKISHGLYSDAIVRVFKATGDLDDFKESLKYFADVADREMQQFRAIMKTLAFIEPEQLLSFDPRHLDKVRTHLFASKLNHKTYNKKSFNEFIPVDPRVDNIVALNPLEAVEIVLPGTGENGIDDKFNPQNPDNVDLHDQLVKAYIEDDPDVLEAFINTDFKFWSIINFDDLRFNFLPYQLTPLKAAVVLKKPKILSYLMSRPNASMTVTTKDQLTALEMAACYEPEFLITHIVPLVKGSCSKRLHVTNHVIEMLKDTRTQICPTGATNAPKLMEQLMDAKCMDVVNNDYVVEAFKHDYPADLIIGLHSTEHFKKNDYYLELSAKRGDLKLIKYFFEKLDKKEGHSAITEGLVTWVRFTDGLMTESNIQTLQFFLQTELVNKNAKSSKTGATALSHATQRSLTWIVKRLLLDPKINVNVADSLTLTSSLQHSIKSFHSESSLILKKPTEELIKEALKKLHMPDDVIDSFFKPSGALKDHAVQLLVNNPMFIEALRNLGISAEAISELIKRPEDPIYEIANQFGDIIGAGHFNWIRNDNSEDKYKKIVLDVRDAFDDIENNFFEVLMRELRLSRNAARLLANTILVDLKVTHLLNSIQAKTAFQIVPIISDFIDSFEIYLEKLHGENIDASLAAKFSVKSIIQVRYMDSILKNISEVFYKSASIEMTKKKTEDHLIQGLLHNILLAHPDIDSTIPDSSNMDALALSKTRATLLMGDTDAADEMFRAHVRVRNVDALHDGRKTVGRVFIGIGSAIFIGTVSAGLIKWML